MNHHVFSPHDFIQYFIPPDPLSNVIPLFISSDPQSGATQFGMAAARLIRRKAHACLPSGQRGVAERDWMFNLPVRNTLV